MALRKEISVNDELEFELSPQSGLTNVKIRLTEVVGRRAILLIMANKDAVPIRHTKSNHYNKDKHEVFP
jgi:hypothetical protein